MAEREIAVGRCEFSSKVSMYTRTNGFIALFLIANACGGDSASGPAFESVAGSYSGSVTGVTLGIALNATVGFTLTQSSGTLSGAWSISGTLNDGVTSAAISNTGTLGGTVASGNNPSVNITIVVPSCPNYRATFSGAYDVANRRITMTGPIDILYNDCSLFLRYQTTLIISR